MKQEIKFVNTLTNDGRDIFTQTPRKVEITMYGQATLDDVAENFTYFLKAVGYHIPENCELDWVDIETGLPPKEGEEV